MNPSPFLPGAQTPANLAGGPADAPPDADLLDELSPAQWQALRWSVRLGDAPAPAVQAEFRQWLHADAAHQAAYEDMAGVMAAVDAIPPEGTARLRTTQAIGNAQQSSAGQAVPQRQAPPPAAVPARPGPVPAPVRRRLAQPLAALLALAVIGGGWFGWDRWQGQPVFEQHFATRRGQQTEVQLPDGSRLHLDTATDAEVALYRGRREVRLPEGQAVFEVQGDKARPFDVLAGSARITVVGTRFAVRHTPSLGSQAVQVSVIEGRVRVASAHGADRAVDLLPGQSMGIDGQGRLGHVSALPVQAVAPWREQRLSFENTPLDRVLAELGRYGDFGLRITDPATAALAVTASVDLRQVDRFVRSLPRVLPVRLRVRDGLTEIEGLGP